MNHENELSSIISSLNISSIEIIIICTIALIGSIIHESILIMKQKNKKVDHIRTTISVISSTIIITIICISINPLIIKVSSRLILLPPLILSLAGSDLIIYLTGFKSSAKLIEYILSFFGINRSKDNIQDVTELDEVFNSDQKNNYNNSKKNEVENDNNSSELDKKEEENDDNNENLDNKIDEILLIISSLKEKIDTDNISNSDFIWNFVSIKEEIEIVKNIILEMKAVDPNILIKFTNIIELESELGLLFKKIVDSTKE